MTKICKVVVLSAMFVAISFMQSNLAFASSIEELYSVYNAISSNDISSLTYIKPHNSDEKLYKGDMYGLQVVALVYNDKQVTAFDIAGNVSDSDLIVDFISKKYNLGYQYANRPDLKGEAYLWYINRKRVIMLTRFYDGTVFLGINPTRVDGYF